MKNTSEPRCKATSSGESTGGFRLCLTTSNKLSCKYEMEWPAEKAARWIKDRQDVFTKEDFQSGDGMQTAIFGPVFWTAIHLVSFNYPVNPTEEQKRQYKEWLLATGNILPCRYCRENFQKNIDAALDGKTLDSMFTSRDSFSRFCHKLHEQVNKMLNKKCFRSFEYVRDMYEGFRSRCLNPAQEDALFKSKEKGCVQEKHRGTKGKCVLKIVPRDIPCEALSVSSHCKVHRI